MKNNILLLLILAVFTFSACSEAADTSKAQSANNAAASNENKAAATNQTNTVSTNASQTKAASENECRICDFDFAAYKGELKQEEVEGLLQALNDEYLAMATYEQVNRDFNDPRPFTNILRAETRHAERLKSLFAAYKIPVPENPWKGSAAKFQTLAEACKAGVAGEIVNRDLYEKLFKSTAREDILIVYRALQKASEENHLPAFERCAAGGGGMRRGGF